MRRGRVLQTQLLGAGEMPIAIALHAHSLLDFKEKGAPIDYAILDPYFAKPSDIVLFQKAPHPHAAAVFIDWVWTDPLGLDRLREQVRMPGGKEKGSHHGREKKVHSNFQAAGSRGAVK